MSKVKCKRFAFDATADSALRTQAAHGTGCVLPAGAHILGGYVEVITTFTSTAGGTDKATLAIHIKAANDIISAVSIETGTSWDDGLHAIVPKFNTPESTAIILTADSEVTVTIGVCAITGGKLYGYLLYTTNNPAT